jgi:AcrR family transcriptional regulator
LSVATKPVLHREDWVVAGLDVLAARGLSGLRVQPLARQLGVTTGSFYWHFKNRDDLIEAMLAYWIDTLTTIVVSRVWAEEEHPARRLRRLASVVVTESGGRYDLAFRNWAAHDAEVATLVGRVDRERLDAVQSQFLELGFDDLQAEMRARTYTYYLEMEPAFFAPESAKRRLELLEARLDMLLADAGCPSR